MVGYYREFCNNFSMVTESLTTLLSPTIPFRWSCDCQLAFENVKAVLCSAHVLTALDFTKPFKLEIDASGIGIAAVLLQEDEEGVDHPVCYYSCEFNKYQVK